MLQMSLLVISSTGFELVSSCWFVDKHSLENNVREVSWWDKVTWPRMKEYQNNNIAKITYGTFLSGPCWWDETLDIECNYDRPNFWRQIWNPQLKGHGLTMKWDKFDRWGRSWKTKITHQGRPGAGLLRIEGESDRDAGAEWRTPVSQC